MKHRTKITDNYRKKQIKLFHIVITLLILSVILSGCVRPPSSSFEKGKRKNPEIYGIKLPVLNSKTKSYNGLYPQMVVDSLIPFRMKINKEGLIESFDLTGLDSLSENYIRSIFDSAKFIPGKINRKKSDMYLPAFLWIRPGGQNPLLKFPYDNITGEVDSYLLQVGLEDNGLKPAEILSFPSYFSQVTEEDSLHYSPIFIAEVNFNKNGKIVDIEPFFNRGENLTKQLLTAVNYGNYRPAMFNDEVISEKQLIVYQFFTEMSYPSKALDFVNDSSTSQFELNRVRFVYPQSGYYCLPIPRNFALGTISPSGFKALDSNLISFSVVVDTTGRVNLLNRSTTSRFIKQVQSIITSNLRFYPAMSDRGMLVPFRGTMYVEFDNSKTIRIRCTWLEPPPFPPLP